MRYLPITLAALALTLTACEVMEAPAGYAILEPRGEQLFHAVSSAGNAIEVREVESTPGASVEFWVEAVQRELVRGRGYELREGPKTFTADGRPGRWMLFNAPREVGEYLYLIALLPVERGVFLARKRLLIAEAGGLADEFERDLPALQAALTTLR